MPTATQVKKAVKKLDKPIYVIAAQYGISPVTLGRVMNHGLVVSNYQTKKSIQKIIEAARAK